METSVISGLIGGVVAVLLVSYISSRIRGKASEGQLKFGWGLLVLGCCCLGFVALAIWALFYDLDAWERPTELLSIIGLFIGFGAGAVYCFIEYFKAYGSYDKNSIVFNSPWTGKKEEKWSDLVSVEYKSNASWYVLSFKSGKKIRLSRLLSGHGGVLDILEDKGYDF